MGVITMADTTLLVRFVFSRCSVMNDIHDFAVAKISMHSNVKMVHVWKKLPWYPGDKLPYIPLYRIALGMSLGIWSHGIPRQFCHDRLGESPILLHISSKCINWWGIKARTPGDWWWLVTLDGLPVWFPSRIARAAVWLGWSLCKITYAISCDQPPVSRQVFLL